MTRPDDGFVRVTQIQNIYNSDTLKLLAPTSTNKIHWTPSLVAERLEEAAGVLKKLPSVKVGGYYSTWPDLLPERSDLVGREPTLVNRLHPSPIEITRMEQTLFWTVDLDETDAKIVWRRAYREPWKRIAARFGKPRQTVAEHWFYGLCVIAWQLNNGKDLPKNVSRIQLLRKYRQERRREKEMMRDNLVQCPEKKAPPAFYLQRDESYSDFL